MSFSIFLLFKYKYIDKIPELTKSIELCLGKAVHESLEWLYREVKKNKIPSVDELIINYSESWKKNYDSDDLVVNHNLTPKDYFNKGVQFLLSYYKKHHPFDDNTIDIEKRIVVRLDQTGNYLMQGFIDRLAYNIQENRYEIHDYKTSNSIPTQEKIDTDKQLALYSIAIKELFGEEKEVVLIWHYLAHDLKIKSKRTPEQLANLKIETLELIKKIESTERFPPQVSKLCDWCEYKRICPAWGNKPGRYDTQKKIEDFKNIDNKNGPLDIW